MYHHTTEPLERKSLQKGQGRGRRYPVNAHSAPRFQTLWSRDQWAGLPVHRSILSPLMLLERTLHVFPEKIGVVDGDRRFTYAEFGERVYRLASGLRRRGIEKGDRVALLCRNSVEALEA